MNRFFVLIGLVVLSSLAYSEKLSGVVKAGGTSAVVLEPAAAKPSPAPTQTVTLDQRGMKFNPSLLVIQQGTTVEFKNSDTVSHNVFWPNISGNKKLGHNLGTASSGQTQRFKFENAGNVPRRNTEIRVRVGERAGDRRPSGVARIPRSKFAPGFDCSSRFRDAQRNLVGQ